jgi:hypothetical protein
MPSYEYDRRYLQAGIDQLEAYLLAEELYWPAGVSAPQGQPPYPQLTPGGLLLARQRLQATAETPAQQAELARLESRLEALLSQWRTAWGKKARQDFHARLKLWRDFLEEYREKPSAHHDRYTYEVGRRAQLHLLAPEAIDLPPAETDTLNGLDKLLRAIFRPGAFVWEMRLTSSFPPTTYWYLYGSLGAEIIEAGS